MDILGLMSDADLGRSLLIPQIDPFIHMQAQSSAPLEIWFLVHSATFELFGTTVNWIYPGIITLIKSFELQINGDSWSAS